MKTLLTSIVIAISLVTTSANGNKIAGELFRDGLEAKMTAEDISKATAMARECMASGYKKCGY